MRKVILLCLFAFFSISAFSTGSDSDYILTEKTCYYFKKIRNGIGSCLVGITRDGKKHKFSYSEVVRYKKNGYLYEKVPLIINNIKSSSSDFMKVICRRAEMTLYEHTNKKLKKKRSTRYYVFRNENFVVELSGDLDANLLAKFNLVN